MATLAIDDDIMILDEELEACTEEQKDINIFEMLVVQQLQA